MPFFAPMAGTKAPDPHDFNDSVWGMHWGMLFLDFYSNVWAPLACQLSHLLCFMHWFWRVRVVCDDEDKDDLLVMMIY